MKNRMIAATIIVILATACRPSTSPTSTPTIPPSETPPATVTTIPIEISTNTPSITPSITPSLEPNYSFTLDKETVDVIWNEDGSLTVSYAFTFTNDLSGSPIDFVDIYIPSNNYDLQDIQAQVDGLDIHHIEESTYFPGAIELGLDQNAIRPGETGEVSAQINQILDVLYVDPEDELDVSAVFFPTWFDLDFVHGITDMTIIFHLPLGVLPSEIRWHQVPPNWPNEPSQGIDEQERITYTWNNPNASGYSRYLLGISFPKSYLPEIAIVQPEELDRMYAESFFNRGRSFANVGDYAKAITDYDHAIYLKSTSPVLYYSRGYAHAANNDIDQAIADFDQTILLDPNFAPAYFTRGVVYSIKGDLNQAIADYNQAISIDPEYALAYFNRGWAYKDLGEREMAIADLERAVELGLDPRTEQTAIKLLGDLRE